MGMGATFRIVALHGFHVHICTFVDCLLIAGAVAIEAGTLGTLGCWETCLYRHVVVEIQFPARYLPFYGVQNINIRQSDSYPSRWQRAGGWRGPASKRAQRKQTWGGISAPECLIGPHV